MNDMKEHIHRHWDHSRFSPLAIAGMVIGGLVLAVLFGFLFGWIVMYLWNYLMPVIFGLPVISFWQAWGLVVLSHILIKPGYGSHGHHGKGRGKDCRNGWREEVKEKFTTSDEVKE